MFCVVLGNVTIILCYLTI